MGSSAARRWVRDVFFMIEMGNCGKLDTVLKKGTFKMGKALIWDGIILEMVGQVIGVHGFAFV